MQSLFQDIRYAFQLLLRDPMFHVVALITLGLTIGANGVLFSVIHAVLLAPLPYDQPSELVTLYNSYPGWDAEKTANTAPDYIDRRAHTDVFSGVALFGHRDLNAGGGGSPERLSGMEVTPSFFRVLRVEPAMGRAFTEEEGQLGNHLVVIISHGLWQRYFGGDPDVIGRDLTLNGVPFRIVGVMGEDFERATPSTTQPPRAQFWIPLAFTPAELSDNARHSNRWEMIARLQPGVTIEQARAVVDTINRNNEQLYPEHVAMLRSVGFHTVVEGLREEMGRAMRPTLLLLQAGVLVVLLIGCVNIANLLLVRATVRQREFSIRAAIGAGRGRLVRQLFAESLVVGLSGAAMGLALGAVGIRIVTRFPIEDLPRSAGIGLDWSVVGFMLLLGVAASLIFGAVPILRVISEDFSSLMRGVGRTGTSDRMAQLTRSALVVSQVAAAFILVIGAALLIVSLQRVLDVNPGFRTDKLLTGWISLPRGRYESPEQVRTFTTRVLDQARQTPGIRRVSSSNYLPFTGFDIGTAIQVEGRETAPGELPPAPAWTTIDREYFDVMGIPIIEGRGFDSTDTNDAPRVTVIDEVLAKRFWPNDSPLGKRIRLGIEPTDPAATVVGVARAVSLNNLADTQPRGTIYFPYQQNTSTVVILVAETEADPASSIGLLRGAVARVDPELPLYDVATMADRVENSLSGRRAVVWLAGAFAGLALLLAAIGIYGVLAYAVSQRTQEIGVRMALGAGAGEVIRLFIGHGLKLTAAGLVGGIVGAFLLTRSLQSLLFGVAPTDPLVFASVAAILAAVAVLASLLPSLRAVRVNPSAALRHQ